ncbi:MAG: hypothetical protein A3C93_05695 [Candidatus Lloydbacteria bacterium RIFCSPHIGHO2_02_FULL_54_17]|uniref:Band 7 domain-containing protein n=1 Tax=Candidatus Lloydbacteria bacterium RIFCSPHIGHO2_02_FULL_54_17 TaxID=1798664 RepID=A0A1G2DAW6_9BACT|nr:MAG: hypothetical protein A2762_03165 [Candidatus Lloydbacteria bacterium RIFCSPHIGHO2_01_FULL_54_11]OGZ10777.1 MAG: hypothetical protein A3C93_05695 [Candidatus Lloydbacteria bacterium RIFCSPHIGHO2_02_FULL_54_17]OGZ13078.1 MAG: hypothetical protein A2948_03675 [Candidatus Lloydbacteria bacterium RIFCSPLOWO2_01_FULL_54_18]OGZ16525.1 MAG: hypothetical protein A3H76_04535 [Candidatus Lloydbacteria bacterium RIFCSPLOWO2_02_FULL_54_12]
MFIALGVLLGMLLAIGTVLRATISLWLPAIAKWLENDPKHPEKFAATTRVGPNKSKFKMRGGKVVRLLTNVPGSKKKGGPTAPEKYEIVPLAAGEVLPPENMGLIDDAFFRYSGYRFFNPFSERIYIYEFPRTEEVMSENGVLTVRGKTDWSDYFLLAEQTYSFSIDNAETLHGENVKVTLHGKVTFQIVNPFKAAFADKKWHQQSISGIQVRGRNFVRARDFDTLLGEVGKESDELKDTIGRDLTKVTDQLESGPGTRELFGVVVKRVQVETIDMTDAEAEKSRTAKYTAHRNAEVTSINAKAEAERKKTVRAADAEADAKYVLKYTRALKAAGPIGTKLLDQQTQLGVAQKAGTVIMQIGGGATIDPINAQILEEQKKSNVLLEQSLAGGRPPKKGA